MCECVCVKVTRRGEKIPEGCESVGGGVWVQCRGRGCWGCVQEAAWASVSQSRQKLHVGEGTGEEFGLSRPRS